jgi:NADPH:quinone reductase
LKNVSIIGLHWGAYFQNEQEAIPGVFLMLVRLIQVWEGIYKLIDEGKLKPIVYDEKFDGLESVGKALQKLGSRGTWGKVIVDVKPDANLKSML